MVLVFFVFKRYSRVINLVNDMLTARYCLYSRCRLGYSINQLITRWNQITLFMLIWTITRYKTWSKKYLNLAHGPAWLIFRSWIALNCQFSLLKPNGAIYYWTQDFFIGRHLRHNYLIELYIFRILCCIFNRLILLDQIIIIKRVPKLI